MLKAKSEMRLLKYLAGNDPFQWVRSSLGKAKDAIGLSDEGAVKDISERVLATLAYLFP